MFSSVQIRTIRGQTLERIAEITATAKPSYSIDGQSVSWNEYLRQLQQTVEWCDEMLTREEPCTIVSQGIA